MLLDKQIEGSYYLKLGLQSLVLTLALIGIMQFRINLTCELQ